MGLFDDILEEEGMVEPPPQKQSAIRKGGLFDDILEEEGMLAEDQSQFDADYFTPKPLKTEKKELPEGQSVFRQVADVPLGVARGGVIGIKMMTDILGADNPVSKSLAGVEGYMADLMSAQAKEDQQEIARIMKDAEDKGFGEQVKAGIKAFSIAPVDIMSQALGTMAPVLATGLAGGAAKLGALGIRGLQLGVGAGMGAGMIKGEIYNEVKNELINSGTPEEVAEKAAVDAQAYGGKNLDQILLGAGLGAASTLGAEGIITRILTKQGKASTAGLISRTLKGGITEAIPEGFQAAQEQLAKNVALQREGFDVDPSRGVVAAATMEAIAGAPLGGIAGAVERPAKVKTLEEEKFEQTNEIARKVAESGAPLTASALQDKAAANLNQDELARKLDEELSLTAVKPTAASPTAIPTKDDYVARYSAIAQAAPEEITRAEQSFTNELATADTEEKRINAQNALDAIKEVKAVGITPAAQPVTPVTQQPTIDAAQEIIQQQGVRQEPQDGTQVGATPEASVSDSVLGAEGIQEEGQVDSTIFDLQSVANNTATREQISSLSLSGLVDIRKGQAIINEDGEGILAQAQAPLPKLTPEERAAEVEAAPATPIPSEPIIGEIPQTSPIVGEAITETTPVEQVAPQKTITVFHATDTQPKSGQKSGYYPGTYTGIDEGFVKDFGKNLFSTQVDIDKIYKVSNESDSQQLKKDARNAGFDVRNANGNGETQYLISNGYEAIQRGKEIILLSPEKYNFSKIQKQPAEPIILEKPQTSEIVGAETPAIVEQEQVVPVERAIDVARKTNFAAATTREEAGDIGRNLASQDPNLPPLPPQQFEVLESISNFQNRKGYNPDVLTEELINEARNNGFITGKQLGKIKFTETGRNQLREWSDQARERSLAQSALSDEISDIAVSQWDAANDPTSAAAMAAQTATPPAPVTEQAAPAEAPAPEVAPIQRDVTKPEQMTPGERGIQGHKLVIEQARQDLELAKTGQTFGFSGGQTYKSKAAAIKDTKNTFERVSQPTEADIKRGASDHYGEINRAVSDSRPVSIDAVEVYGVTLPEGYAKQGDLYVYQPTPAVSETITEPAQAAAPAQPTEFGFVKDIDSTRENIKKNLIRFASGMSGLSDMRRGSYARAGHRNYGVGAVAGLLSKNTTNELADRIINLDVHTFIDSGAFGHFIKEQKLKLEGKTLPPLNFDKILAKYDLIIDEINNANSVERDDYPRPLIVTPDKLGDQNESLNLTEKYKNWIAARIEFNDAIPIIPIPLGKLTLPQAYNRIVEILKTNTIGAEINPNKFIVGIPSNATAVSKEDLANFLQETKHPRIHFLGAAADSKIAPLIDVVAKVSPDTLVTADASPVRSKIANAKKEGKTRDAATFDALYQEDDPNVILDSIGKNPEQLTPTEPEIIAPTTQPESIAVGNRIKFDNSPQTYTIEEVIPQTAKDQELEEKYYSVKNERTGEVQVVEERDLKKVGGKKVRKMAVATKLSDSLDSGEFNSAQALVDQGTTMDRETFIRSITPSATQRATTIHTRLEKDGVISKEEFTDGMGLVYGDGRGAASSYLGGQSYEPFPPAGFTPDYTGDRVEGKGDAIDGKFSTILNTFVLNVVDPQTRAFIVKDIANLLQNGGRAVFVTRGSDVANSKALVSFAPLERIQRSEGKLTYQKGFTQSELIKYLKETLGDGFSVKGLRGGTASDIRVEVIKNTDAELNNPPITQDIRLQAVELKNEEIVTPIPEANRYTYEEAVRLVDSYFDKEGIPEGVVIVNNTTDKDLEMKAGYFVNRGQIVINLAYIAKGENLSDIISHELGHYIFGDPQFQADFKSFWEAMTPEEQAEADRLINQFYNKETGAVQMEEKQVRAFLQLIQDSNAQPKWRQLLDSIKRWINEKLGTNFQVTDGGALAVLAAAHKRFKSGERIIREIDSGVLKMAAEPRREQVAGKPRGDIITTPEGIIEQTNEVLRNKFFDGSVVSDENTSAAWDYIEQLLDIKSGAAYDLAGQINNVVDQETNSKTRMGAGLFSVSLTNYAAKLSAQGDNAMISYLVRRNNRMPTDNRGGTATDAGRVLRGKREYDIDGYHTIMTEHESKVERTAATLFGTGKPSKQQVAAVDAAIEASEDTSIGNPEDVAGEVEKVEKRTGRKVIKKIEDKIKESTEPKKEELLISFENLDADRKIKGITLKYNPQKVNVAKNIKDFIIGKMVDYRKTLINQGASGLESTFWQTMSDNENKPGPLGEIDQAQNNELAKIVQKTLIDLGLKGEPPNTKMTDIEKVASILNKQKLSDEKRLEADSRIVEEIERRRESDLASGYTPEVVNAKYDIILDAWNQSMSRQLNMPVSDNMLQRLISSELKEQNINISNLIEEVDGKVVVKTKQGIVDSIIRKIYKVSKESETGIEMDENYDGLKGYLEQTLDNMYARQIEKKNAAYAKRQAKISLRNNVEGQAQSIIDQLADQLSDTPAFPEKQENQVKAIVQQDLRQRPDMKRKQPWTSQLTAKLMQAGVSEVQAQTISDLVWRQHEIKTMDRELKELETAAEKGSLAVIIQRIKDTPLEDQQKPEWMQGVIREYLIEAGLSSQAADTAARLYESVIAERFAEAKQKAFEDTLAKSAPWNNYLSRNAQLGKNALKKIQDAIRTGVLDPTQTTEGIIAKENGWSGFSKEQLTRIVQLDGILYDKNSDQVTKAEAMSELNKIIVKAKMPVRFKDAISAFYVGQALMGIPTFTVNIASPTFFAIRNFSIDIAKYAVTDPKMIPVAFQSFINSFKSLYDNTMYAFKNQIYMSGEIEYMQGQNILSELFDKGKAQWAKGDYANGMGNMLVGTSQITGRILSSLDQGAIEMMQSQNITRYVIEAMSGNKKISKDKRSEIVNIAISGRRKIKQDLIASGMAPDRAGVLAELKVRDELMASLSEFGIKGTDVLNASINDALQSVGRNRAITINSLTKEQNNLRDAGILSGIPIGFLEGVAQWANKGNQSQQVFAKMIYGFALVPARVFSTALWFSPIGFVRLGVDAAIKRGGGESRYALSLATEFQQKQRLIEAIAGTALLVGLSSLLSSSTDDDEEKPFKIVVTGNGPDYNTDRQYHDSWHKKYKPHTTHIIIGGLNIPINIGRGGEAISIPLIFLGAQDDARIKEKLNQARKSPADLEMAAEVLGSAFYSFSNRGPFAAFTKPLFDAKKPDKVVPNLVSQIGYFGKTFIPIVGTSLARNISDFINDPIDKSSIQGAIYSNMPIVGPMIGTKALNAFGQPIRADDWGDRLFKLGAPVVMSFPKNTPENELNELVLKKGDGPPIPTRINAQKKFEEPLTDKEFEIYVREYGRVVSDKMFKNRKRLEDMQAKNYTKELDKYVNGYSIDGVEIPGASDMAARAVKRSRNE